MMRTAGFVGQSIVLADGGRGAVIKTAPQCARPSAGATVLLPVDGASIAVVGVVLAEADGCQEIVSVVSLQSGTAAL